jgi:hypothetical protein
MDLLKDLNHVKLVVESQPATLTNELSLQSVFKSEMLEKWNSLTLASKY